MIQQMDIRLKISRNTDDPIHFSDIDKLLLQFEEMCNREGFRITDSNSSISNKSSNDEELISKDEMNLS